jgi:hypothetical protein
LVSPGATVPHADTLEAPGNLLAPEPAVRTGALIGYARVSTVGQPVPAVPDGADRNRKRERKKHA